jgi:hypothetical protein
LSASAVRSAIDTSIAAAPLSNSVATWRYGRVLRCCFGGLTSIADEMHADHARLVPGE